MEYIASLKAVRPMYGQISLEQWFDWLVPLPEGVLVRFSFIFVLLVPVSALPKIAYMT
jgi:hypothetical protein